LGIGDWGLGIGPNPQSPIPNPQDSFKIKYYIKFTIYLKLDFLKYFMNSLKNIIKI